MIFLHPSSIPWPYLLPSLCPSCLSCCVCILVAEKRSAEAMAAMVALSPGVLAPTSRNTLHFGLTFRSSKLLCTGQARSRHRVMSFFSSLSFLSFISLSLPPLLFYICVQFVRACVCVPPPTPNIIFCIPRKGREKREVIRFSLNHGHFASNFYNGPCRRGSLCLAVSCIIRLFVISFEEQGIKLF